METESIKSSTMDSSVPDNRKQRIVLFVGNLEAGGVAQVALNLAGEFWKRGFAVDLVAARAEGELRNRVPEGVRVVDLGTGRLLRSVLALSRYLRQSEPLAVISLTDLANVVAIVAKAISGVKFRLVISCHMALSDLPIDARRFVHRLLPFLMRVTYRHADAVVAVSDTVAQQISHLSGSDRSRILVINNPVDIDQVIDLSTQAIDHSWFGGETPVILSVGRLVPQKDFPTLIRAFSILRKKMKARLVILGEGQARGKLETLIRSLDIEVDAILPGYVENPFAYMRRASVFVLPSSTEAFGLVLVEALACGCRVVSTDASEGPKTILGEEEFGNLIPSGDPEAMAAAILQSLTKRIDEDILVQRAREISDPGKCVELYLSAMGL